MPQMSPLNWIMLFIYFSVIFVILNSVNYFILSYKNKNIKNNKTQKLLNWKW